MTRYSRREFLKRSLLSAAGLGLLQAGCAPSTAPAAQGAPTATRSQPPAPTAAQAYLSVARGPDPEALTRAAVAALGGIQRFVQKGQVVIIKPNICVDYHPPEYAATTNPAVVAAVVKLCLEAGAGKVKVMDAPFGGTADSAYSKSGIREAVEAAGGSMEIMAPAKFVRYEIPDGKDIQAWNFYRDALEADVLINLPIAKHHSLARLTLGGKNLLGLVSNVGQLHRNLGQRIADVTSRVRPTLTIVDAVRILVDHGPTGGSLDDVQQTNTVIASHDLVAADAWAATLFGLSGKDIDYIRASDKMGLGTLDLKSLKIEEINL
jgi:uncharacterized protein (DUF362 family)